MAINTSVIFSPKVVERYKRGSITDSAAGNSYSFVGAKTVKVYSVDVATLNDFDRTAASNRFGAVANLGDTIQEMTCTQDKGFTYALDLGDGTDQTIRKSAGESLRREIDEVINPTKDKYRLAAWCKGAGNSNVIAKASALTKNTAYDAVIDTNALMTEDLVPTENRTIFCSVDFYKLLKQSPAYLGIDALGQKVVERGVVGLADGCKVIPVPTTWMPANTYFLIKYGDSTVDPIKLSNFDILEKVQGFSGPVVQGRLYYDAFVLAAKKDGLGVCTLAAA